MKIGELAASSDVTAKTVRFYESLGLLAPPSRTSSGYRDYDAAAVERLRFIRDAQASGLTLAEIQSVLELKDSGSASCEHTQSLLKRHLIDLDEQIERLQQSRTVMAAMAQRADAVDPAACSDPNRCQVIAPS